MAHSDTLILTLVGAFVLAFVLGMVALRLKLSPLVGYLVAGVAVGPFTPGWVADAGLASQLADIGVILLMFGVGLHFSPQDLMRVRNVVAPGALAKVAGVSLLGWGVGRAIGLGGAEAALLGFSLSVASTVVVLKGLEDRKALKSDLGRLAIGWLVVEDLIAILALVMLPLIAHFGAGDSPAVLVGRIGWTLVKVAAFMTLMLVVGARALPWLLVRIAHTRSRELFTLGVLSIALGIAYLAYSVFGASFALGAFVAGLVLNASPLGHSAAERALPLRDAFAVLFFVSVGMLFDPSILIREPLAVAAVLLVIVLAAPLFALAATRVLKVVPSQGLMLSAGIGQVGEFSFILAGLGMTLGIMTRQTYDLILAAALISIAINPFVLNLAAVIARRFAEAPAAVPTP